MLLVMAALGAIGCVTSAEPAYYALASTSGPPQPATWAHVVELRRPGLAGYLDRPDIVRRVVDYRLRLASGDRWAEPLGDMFGRVLAEDLTERLPGTSVFTEASAISAVPDAVIEVEIERFDASADGTVTLLAQVLVEGGGDHRTIASSTFDLQDHPAGADTESAVATLSRLVGRLGDGIATLMRTPPAPSAAR